jgi:nicotinamidase-related amidase
MRMLPATTLLGVIDIQERLIAAVPAADFVVARSARLAEAARILGVRAVLTEQYPKGLGPTPAALAALLSPAVAKMSFSSCGCGPFAAAVDDPAPLAVESAVLCGLETHVCIAQTALDLLARGLAVFIAVDAVASRHTLDHEVALRRLEGAGAILTTTEAILFEWCRTAEHPQFQAVRRLVV